MTGSSGNWLTPLFPRAASPIPAGSKPPGSMEKCAAPRNLKNSFGSQPGPGRKRDAAPVHDRSASTARKVCGVRPIVPLIHYQPCGQPREPAARPGAVRFGHPHIWPGATCSSRLDAVSGPRAFGAGVRGRGASTRSGISARPRPGCSSSGICAGWLAGSRAFGGGRPVGSAGTAVRAGALMPKRFSPVRGIS